MTKRALILIAFLILVTACGSFRRTGGETYNAAQDLVSEVTVRESGMQYVQIPQNQVLPPYGVKIAAEVAVLELQIHSNGKKAEDRITDIQNAVAEITALVATDEAIVLGETAVHQVSGSYPQEESSTTNIPSLDTSAVTIKLSSNLSQHEGDFGESILAFNDFLKKINLPDTIKIQVVSVTAELGDIEGFREQLVAQVYQELDSIRQEYGPAVKFEVTGLHTPLKQIQLSDTEYYLYLEPTITVTEF